MQIACVMPVVKMPAMTRHALDRLQRVGQPLQGGALADPTEVMRRDRGQKVKPDVGGRGAAGDGRFRRFLKIVWRQVIFVCRHEGFKIAPGAARDQPQRGGLGLGQDFSSNYPPGQTDPAGHRRGGKPGQRKSRWQGPSRRVDQKRPATGTKPKGKAGQHPQILAQGRRKPATARLRGGHPLQQMPPRHGQPPSGACNGIEHRGRRIGQKHKAEGDLAKSRQSINPKGGKMAAQRHPEAGGHQAERQGQHARQGQHGDDQNRPQKRERQRQHPARKKRQNHHRSQQRPAQVVDHLPAPDRRNPASFAPPLPEDPRQKLPVTPHPPMLAADVDVMAGGKILNHLDVRGQRGTGKHPLEEIMAEHGVFWHTARQRRLERVDVVDALASEGAFVKEVLVDVRSGRRIRLDPARAGEKLPVDRSVFAAGQAGADAGLQDAVAARYPLTDAVKAGAVQGVAHLAHHLRHGPAQQPCVGVQRDDISDVRWQRAADDSKAGVRSRAQQAVQFGQLAALALPPHPDAF